MRIIDISQGSNEWLALRQSKITGTDAAILTGSNPFKTKLQLWQQKLGLLEPDECTPKMKRGSELEPFARKLFNESLGIDFQPAVAVSDEYPWMMASLDGLSQTHRIMCEIKCPTNISAHEETLKDCYPSYYYDQIQHCLLVTGCEVCLYCTYHPDHEQKIAIIQVYPDLEKQAEIIAKGQEFYINMCTMNPPEEWKFKLKE